MDFKEYQKVSADTWKGVPVNDDGLAYLTLGMCNEAGEFAGKIKKVFRDKYGVISPDTKENLKSELGDVLWYLTQLASNLDMDMEDLAKSNIMKLASRKVRGKIRGEGDNR